MGFPISVGLSSLAKHYRKMVQNCGPMSATLITQLKLTFILYRLIPFRNGFRLLFGLQESFTGPGHLFNANLYVNDNSDSLAYTAWRMCLSKTGIYKYGAKGKLLSFPTFCAHSTTKFWPS